MKAQRIYRISILPVLSPTPSATVTGNQNTATPTIGTPGSGKPDPLATRPAETPAPLATVTPTLISEITLIPPPVSTPTQTPVTSIPPHLFDQALFLPYMVNGTR